MQKQSPDFIKPNLMQSISLEAKPNSIQNTAALDLLKKGIWLYFILLIFEGALRKWVLPGLATPLLIVRDPLAIFLIFKAIQSGYFKANLYIIVAWVLTFLSFYATLIFGHGNLYVAFYGLRIFALHFPLIFIIARIFNRQDVIQMGKVLLWIHIGMTVLVAIQFYSPQTAWVNMGVGGDEAGSGFSGAAGYFRVPGTFSFTNGLTLFYSFTTAFIFYFWIDAKAQISKIVLFVATFALLAAIPLCVSRSLFFQVIIALLFTLVIASRSPKNLFRILGSVILGYALFYILSTMPFFQTATFAFTERFETANENEGGLEGVFLDRFLGGMLNALTANLDSHFWGQGLGMGTNAGAKLMTGETTFLISEGEWGRLIGEMGIMLGFIAVLLRMFLSFSNLRKAWKSISIGNYLPWLLASFATLSILQGQWAQPTSLGFSVLAGGLLLASLKSEEG
jgi:hypothetical protein